MPSGSTPQSSGPRDKRLGVAVGNKGEIIPEFSLEITQFDFTKKRWQR